MKKNNSQLNSPIHVHILGICGTFMAGVASLAKSMGYHVTGCDANIYPPMSDYLKSQDIKIISGFDAEQLDEIKINNNYPDYIIVGNIIKRGMPVIERVLREKLAYISGPQWLREHILNERKVIAVAGTHGKTSISSMLAWILTDQGLDPGYLIGGISKNLAHPASLGANKSGSYFVIEADEYDTAFFDKRAKLVHYMSEILILNNLEFDHADIYSDITAINTQMHHAIRIMPDNGLIIYPADLVKYSNIPDVLAMGCWSNKSGFMVLDYADKLKNNPGWVIQALTPDASEFKIYKDAKQVAKGKWNLFGLHNLHNLLAAVIAACHCEISKDKNKNKNKYISAQMAVESLANFKGVKRRCECIYSFNNIKLYDDFAHHPTAVYETLSALRASFKGQAQQGVANNIRDNKLIVMLEPRTRTMQMNLHQDKLIAALKLADIVYIYTSDKLNWKIDPYLENLPKCHHFNDIKTMCEHFCVNHGHNNQDDSDNKLNMQHCVIMSNGGFAGVHDLLRSQLGQAGN